MALDSSFGENGKLDEKIDKDCAYDDDESAEADVFIEHFLAFVGFECLVEVESQVMVQEDDVGRPHNGQQYYEESTVRHGVP